MNSTATGARVDMGDHIDIEENNVSAAEQACNALFLTDPQADRDALLAAKGAILNGTCEWLLSHPKLSSWLRGDTSRVLWVSGGPGMGKTMLAIYTTQQLETFIGGNFQVLYYFCSHNDDRRNTPNAIMRSWICQLLQGNPQLIDHVMADFWGKTVTAHTISSLEALWRVFVSLVHNLRSRRIVCLLDGLDECDKGLDEFLSKIHGLFHAQSDLDIRLMAFSRDMQTWLRGWWSDFERIDLDIDTPAEVGNAINIFIQSKINALRTDTTLTTEVLTQVEETLRERSKGETFLWIGFAANELRGKSPLEIQEVLGSIPAGLDGIYERMLEIIHQSDQTRARRLNEEEGKIVQETVFLLQWVILARRPLTVKELAAILGVQSSGTLSDAEIMRDRLQGYGYIFQIHDGTVSFLHQSAAEYLLRTEGFSKSYLNPYRIHVKEASAAIAKLCLERICSTLEENQPLGSEDTTSLSVLKNIPLLEYSIRYWPDHTQQAYEDATDLITMSPMFLNPGVRSRWWKCHLDLCSGVRSMPSSSTLLHLAAYFNLVVLARKELGLDRPRISLSRWLNRKDNHGRTPLSWAAERKHILVASMLIQKGANMEVSEPSGGRPLTRAINSESFEMVKLLLDSGANSNYSMTAPFESLELEKNLKNLDPNTVRLLRVIDGTGAIPILLRFYLRAFDAVMIATVIHVVIVLAMAIVIFTTEATRAGTFGTASFYLLGSSGTLCLLQWYGWIMCYLVLPRSRKSVGCVIQQAIRFLKEIERDTPLTRSFSRPNWTIIKLLLDQGGKYNKRLPQTGRTILSFAADTGNVEIVSRILAAGAQLDAQEGPRAWRICERAMVKAKLYLSISFQEEGLTIRSTLGCTPLARAVRCGKEEVTALLLESGADPNIQDCHGRTPLAYAADAGREGSVRLLLQAGVAIDSPDSYGCTALLRAARSGGAGVIKLLLDGGANVNHENRYGFTPLISAIVYGHIEVIYLLMEHGADVNYRNKLSHTPLMMAAFKGHAEATSLLLAKGAQVNIKSKRGATALCLAVMCGHDDIVRVLLIHGGDLAH